jgi:23S rRNA (uracil1939-C5)-methyltransferase
MSHSLLFIQLFFFFLALCSMPFANYLCAMNRGAKKERKQFHNVEIIDTADEGLAIGRCEDGRIIQVRGAVPGDVVDATALEKRKGMYITKATSFSTLSPERTEPFCSHFGLCGGCKWQHMAYEAQLRYKSKRVKDAFQRIGELDPSIIQPIIGAPFQQYYRNKLEFTASDRRWLTDEEMRSDAILQKDGIGFHLPGAFDKVLDIDHCYLQADPSNAIRLFIKQLSVTHQWPFFNLRSKAGFIRNVIVRNNLAGEAVIVLVVGEANEDWIKVLVDTLAAQFPQVISIYSCINTKVNDSIHDLTAKHEYGSESLIEQLDHVRFHIGPKSFFQTNSLQAASLYALTKKLAALEPGDHVYDLYCGVGSLGIYMADSCKQVVGIELIAEAIADAGKNAALNNMMNTKFVVGQVEMLLDPGFIQQYGRPDVIITDPPRAGMHPDVIRHLLAAAPRRIVYVSCNPATQARDLKMLGDSYAVITAIPVDMFPHTHHIECVALLELK